MFKKFFVTIVFIFPVLIGSDTFAKNVERGMGSGYLYNLFVAPEPDFKFANIDDIKVFKAPKLPIQDREEFIKLALTNKNIREHIFMAISDDHKDLGWRVFADKKENGWLIKMRSKASVPEYKCYFAIDESGNEVEIKAPFKGCKYYSHK